MKINMSTVLTLAGAIGVGATAFLAVSETPRALKLCEALRLDRVNNYEEEPTKLDYVKVAWKCYIPAAAAGLSTIACIFGANVLNRRQQAALMSAYALTDRAYKEYRSKVREVGSDHMDSEIINSIVREKYSDDYVSENEKRQLFYDMTTGRYFESSMEYVELEDGLECVVVDLPFAIP